MTKAKERRNEEDVPNFLLSLTIALFKEDSRSVEKTVYFPLLPFFIPKTANVYPPLHNRHRLVSYALDFFPVSLGKRKRKSRKKERKRVESQTPHLTHDRKAALLSLKSRVSLSRLVKDDDEFVFLCFSP